MIQREVVITDPQGLHALVAQELAIKARTFASSLFLRHQERTARLDEPAAILALGLRQGTRLSVWADGADEIAALEAVLAVLAVARPIDPNRQLEPPGFGEPE